MSELGHVLIVDDDPAVTNAVCHLARAHGFDTTCFHSPADFLAQVDQRPTDCIVLDVRMPGMSGLEVQRQLNARGNRLPVILLTGHADIPMCVEALKQGAYQFLEKPFKPAELIEILQEAVATERRRREAHQERDSVLARLAELSPEERETLDLLLQGKVNKEIASQLDVSVRTVQFRITNMMRKLGVTTRASLVRTVVTAGGD